MASALTRSIVVLAGVTLFGLCVGVCGWTGQIFAQVRPLRPEALPAGTRIQRDVSYGASSRQKLDIYSPPNAKDAPIILMVHGGGWWRGDKSAAGVVQNKIDRWLPEGYLFISVNYRMIPEANPLQQAEDVARALAYVQDHAKAWGGDPSRIILMGHSAGAHLVCLLSAAPAIATQQGAHPWLGTVCLDSAAYNMVTIMERRHPGLYDQAFGTDRQLWKDASPTLRLSSAVKPMLLVYSTRRPLSRAQATAFAEKAMSLGGDVKLLPEDLDHGSINTDLGLAGPYTDKVDAFLRSLTSK